MAKPVKNEDQTGFMLRVLTAQALHLRESNQIVTNCSKRYKTALIVEPRTHDFLECVVRNVMHLLGPDWNLTVVCGSDNEQWLKDRLAGWQVKYINMGINNLTPQMHNKLLMTKTFWSSIREESVLVFQTDSCMLRRGVDEFSDYDFIGAFTLNPHEQAPLDPSRCHIPLGMFNGGFSLRKRSVMLECLEKVTMEDIDLFRKQHGRDTLPSIRFAGSVAEDIYFVHACSILGKRLPADDAIAGQFSTEAVYNRQSIGIHGFDKTFFPFDMLKDMINHSDLSGFVQSTFEDSRRTRPLESVDV